MFKAVLFTIAKIWKQFKCPSTEGQIKKMWCVSTHRHTQTHTDTHTKTHTDRHTYRHIQTHTDTQTDTHTHTQAHTHRHTQAYTDTHRHTAIEKTKIFVICNNMDEQGGYYAK